MPFICGYQRINKSKVIISCKGPVLLDGIFKERGHLKCFILSVKKKLRTKQKNKTESQTFSAVIPLPSANNTKGTAWGQQAPVLPGAQWNSSVPGGLHVHHPVLHFLPQFFQNNYLHV